MSWDNLSDNNFTILSTRVSLSNISDRSFCPENNHRILPLPIYSPSVFEAYKFCGMLGNKLFAPNTKEEFDFFWKITAHSQAMKDKCYTGGRRLMYLGIVKVSGKNDTPIPFCPYPMDDDLGHQNSCILGLNIYTRQAHTGFNVNSYLPRRYPPLPENSTFLVGKNLNKELEMNNITTIEDIFENTYRSLASYTKEPYPGSSLFYTPNIPTPTFPVCTPCHSDSVLATNPILNVRGLCEQTSFDLEFTMIMAETGYVEYIGLRNSVIKFNVESEIWMIQSLLNPKVTAESKALFSTLLLGKHVWHVKDDNKCQAGEKELSVKLST